MQASYETDEFMTSPAQRARRTVLLFVISIGSVGFPQLSGDFQSVLAKDAGNEPSASLSNHFERPSVMLRLQYRVQVMLTHYMLGLLSLLKCSKGKRAERTEKPEAEHKSRGGMKKKSERKRI